MFNFFPSKIAPSGSDFASCLRIYKPNSVLLRFLQLRMDNHLSGLKVTFELERHSPNFTSEHDLAFE